MTSSYIIGNPVTLSTTFSINGVPQNVTGSMVLEVFDPSGAMTTPAVSSPGGGIYTATVLPALLGHWWYRWTAAGQAADEGEFDVTSHFLPVLAAGLHDIRELVPRVQRAVEGVVQQTWTLTTDEIKDVTADACADILLYTGSVFGSDLIVTNRDGTTNAPDEYATSNPLSLAQASVIASQAALTYFYHRFAGAKMSEAIADEASSWEYALSPNLLIAQLKLLQDTRDKALEAVAAQGGGLEEYVSFLAIRDHQTSRYIEPWIYGVSEGFGIGAGGLEGDSRFSGLPVGGGDYTSFGN